MRCGFTLIELLVVVSIVALLVALLLPALGQARERANAAVCVSNLHQLSLGMRTYATDNQNYFPHTTALIFTTPRVLTTFPDLLHDAGVMLGSTSTANRTGFTCPDYDFSTYISQYSAYVNTYAAHLPVVGYWTDAAPPAKWLFERAKPLFIDRPAEVVLLGDGVYQLDPVHVYTSVTKGPEIGQYHVIPNRGDPFLWEAYAHNGFPQAVFVDGHVKAQKGPWLKLKPDDWP